MTPSEVVTYARAKYNATGDTFFSDAELYYYIYQAELELSNECPIVEAVSTTLTTVSGTRQYAFPTSVRMIKRVTITDSAGTILKLEPITFREDDALTLVNVASTTLGKPQFYQIFNYNLYLRPIPDTSSEVITIFSYNEPIVVGQSTTLDIPTNFHMDLVDFVVMQMYTKDKDLAMSQFYKQQWAEAKIRAKRWVQKKKRADAFTVTQNEDNLAVTLSGPV